MAVSRTMHFSWESLLAQNSFESLSMLLGEVLATNPGNDSLLRTDSDAEIGLRTVRDTVLKQKTKHIFEVLNFTLFSTVLTL